MFILTSITVDVVEAEVETKLVLLSLVLPPTDDGHKHHLHQPHCEAAL